jgi:hypothetical protein
MGAKKQMLAERKLNGNIQLWGMTRFWPFSSSET